MPIEADGKPIERRRSVGSEPGAMTPLHLSAAGTGGAWYPLVLMLAGVGGAVLLGGGVAAFLRRGSRSYLLVALALATLLARTGVAVAAELALVSPAAHHLGEHALDVVMAGLVIAAVYYARTATGGAAT